VTETFPTRKLELTPIERRSDVVRKLVAYYEDRLARLRVKNDGDLDDKETARLRGQISECKTFMALAKEPEPEPTESG